MEPFSTLIKIAIIGYKPFGTKIAISNNKKTQVTEHKLNGNRAEIIERAANKAIWELIKFVKALY